MTEVLTVKKWPVLPVSAMAYDEGGPSEEGSEASRHVGKPADELASLLLELSTSNGSPRPYSWARRRPRRVMIVLLPPCMLLTVASSLWPSALC